MTPADREIFIRHLADQALTEPMSIDGLSKYFGVGWRKMRSILAAIPEVEKIDTLYRVPVKKMPPRYLNEQNFL